MAKSLKVFYTLLGLILLSVFLLVIGLTQGYLGMSHSYDWMGFDLDRLPDFLTPGLQYVFFWTSVTLAILTIIGILAVIFYPRTYTEIKLDKANGSLLLKKSAIEAYVKTALKETGLMLNPNVTATLYKRKFDIDVAGRLDSRIGVSEQVSGIKEGIETGFNEFFGLNKPVNFQVRVKDIADSEMIFGKKNRVE
ncbi:alkaline shock response membrane anchor protein AmaP [Streptococcus hongkongensis]|nr:membrane protein [Streptococcus uberis]